MGLALQNLAQDKLRLALSVVGVALPVMLILFMLGLRAGVFRSAVMYLDNTPGSVAVMPAGVKSTSAGSAQSLPRGQSMLSRRRPASRARRPCC